MSDQNKGPATNDNKHHKPLADKRKIADSPMNGLKVLVVDDRRQIHSALQLFLAQSGYGVVVGEITHLDELLEAVLKYQPDLLVLDWDLSGLQPREARRYPLHVLRAVLPQMAIIAMSSHPEAEKDSWTAGVDFFVSKANSPQQLLPILLHDRPQSRLLDQASYRPTRQPMQLAAKEVIHDAPQINHTGSDDRQSHYH